ncbi:hypothetical protein [Streptomyces sp. NPDC049555]|uniref:hypothetical protein n=1 Tax=Streptomyces sp. NPDC049555 TaxID=3154930 RepID=UPI00341A16E3
MFNSHWRVTLQQGSRTSTYSFPASFLSFRTSDAERHARQLHAAATAKGFPTPAWTPVRCLRVRHIHEVYCRDRAVAWAALKTCGAIPDGGGWNGPTARGELKWSTAWREELHAVHASLRGQVIGFGRTFADVLSELNDSPAGWDLEPYTRNGQVAWQEVFDDITNAGTSTVWHTPYGVVWIDNG